MPTVLSPVDAAAAYLAGELEQIGADAGYVGVIDANNLSIGVSRVTRYSEKPVHLIFPANAPYPLVQTLRTHNPLFIANNAALTCDHPGLARVVAEDHACATLPLFDRDGSVIGAINLAFEDPHEFTDDERERIMAIAQRCAAALADALAALN